MALLTLKIISDVSNTAYQIIEFHGELDKSDVATTEKQLTEFLSTFIRPYLIFDVSDLKFINSEGVGFMALIHTKLAKKNQQLILSAPKQHVAEVFELVGLSKLVSIYPTMESALAGVTKT